MTTNTGRNGKRSGKATADTAAHSPNGQTPPLNSAENYLPIAESLSDIIMVIAADGTIRYESPSVKRILGHAPEERIGRKVFEFAHPGDLPAVFAAFRSAFGDQREVLDDLHTAEMRVRHVDGSWRTLQCFGRIHRDDAGDAFAIVTARDITERRRMEEELRETQERYRSLVEACPDAIILTDLDGTILLCNQSAALLHGFEAVDQVLGKKGIDFVAPDERDRALVSIRETMETTGVRDAQFTLLRVDGSRFPAEMSVSVIRDKDGRPSALTTIVRDITERKRVERALIQETAIVKLLQSVAVVANSSSKGKDALRVALDRICAYTGWPVGHVYLLNPSGEAISSRVWHLNSPSRFKAFREATEATTVSRGTGLIGRVLATGQPAWVADTSKDIGFVRKALARKAGLKAGIAFPVLAGQEVAAVIEFHSFDAEESDADLLDLMSHVGTLLGRVIERQRAREEIDRFFAYSFDMLAIAGFDGYLKRANKAFLRTLGFTARELLGMPYEKLVHPDDWPAVLTELQRLATGAATKSFEVRMLCKDGSQRWIEWDAVPLPARQVIYAYGRDITAAKQAQEALRKSADELRDLYNNAPCGYHSVDANGTFVQMNDTELEWLGYKRSEVIGKMRCSDIITPDSLKTYRERLTRLKECGSIRDLEFEFVRKDGTTFPVLISSRAVKDADGNFLMSRSTVYDLSERKSAEALGRKTEELVRSNADLEQFAYIASHDLQEPLRMVTSYCDLLQRRYRDKLDSDAEDFLNFAVDGATRMSALVKDLLAYSRVSNQEERLEPVDCDDVLDRALTNLRSTVQENAAVVTHDSLPTVAGDTTQLEQLFQNLIGNAIKFHGEQRPEIHIGVERKKSEWFFSVHDNGIGIDPQYADRIFGVFQRLHRRKDYPGTGVGLAICKKIVERHGGRIWVESELGQGSNFCFTIVDKSAAPRREGILAG